MSHEARLTELGINLPSAAAAAANYLPTLIVGSQLFVSGQLPMQAGNLLHLGVVGDSVDVDEAYAAARLCGINILAQARHALGGSLDHIHHLIKLGGFVAATAGFTQHPEVINGASDLMVEVLSDAGKHTRFAVGASSLPRGVCVEVEALFAIKPV